MRRAIVVLAVTALGACQDLSVSEGLPYGESIPASAQSVYRIEPRLMRYSFVDSTSGQPLRLTWLTDLPFIGHNCLALTPRSPTDSIGVFVFVARGANVGSMLRESQTGVDTTTGFFLAAGIGSRGTYVLDSQQGLHLFWSNGTPSRYFDPSAAIRIAADSLISDVTTQERGDSIEATWHVVWTISQC